MRHDSDQLTLLIRSLAEPAKSYVLHHSQGESLFSLNPEVMDGNIAGLKGDGKGSNGSVAKTRCSRCGQRDHDGSKCTTDLSKKRCFKCHEFGHISTNWGDAKNSKGSGKRGVRKGKCLLFLMMRHNPGGTLKWMIIKL